MAEMDFGNARDPEQIRRMEELKIKGECHFCGDAPKKHTAPIIYENPHWFVTANDFPYKGSVHHYLIVSRQHVTQVDHLSVESWLELPNAIKWLKNHLGVDGFSIFVRSGKMSVTGATLDHVHWHLIVGEEKSDKTEWLTVTLGYKNRL